MVKDHTGMGCAVGHLICNREHTDVISVFLREVRKKVGRIIVDYFMSDDARAFHNAWCRVMHGSDDDIVKTPVPVKCIWHVFQSWHKKLHEIINNREVEDYLFGFLRTMVHTRNSTHVHQVIV